MNMKRERNFSIRHCLFACFMLLANSLLATSCTQPTTNTMTTPVDTTMTLAPEGFEIATFATGCFWCTEAVFQDIKGISKAESGYMGGSVDNPSYKQVCTGTTGHAECIQVTFDPKVVSYAKLLEVFFSVHDPTTLNRQGADVGTQYRSAIFFHNEDQHKLALDVKAKLEKEKAFSDPIVTEVTKASKFYKAEDYHQDYFNLNGENPYCQMVVKPKVDKFKKVFKDIVK
jgi:peptide-methionine (S)-S-oxide reductase